MIKVYVIDKECVVCMEQEPSSIYRPCGHKCCCESCTEAIRNANMTCPLCRSVIDRVMEHELQDDVIEPVAPALLLDFNREEFIERLRNTHTSNAAFVGKSKFAKSVSRAIGSELEERQMQTQGGERAMAKRSTIEIEIVNGNTLEIDYKVGRKKRHESYRLWPSLEEIKEEARSHGDALELASFYPELYWNLYHWTDGKVNEIFENKKRCL
jgi:Zinc finger, C3HC4 type (RING finger)